MKREDKEIDLKDKISLLQDPNTPVYEKEESIFNVLKQFEPFRKALAKKFANKGVEFDDICQHIDLMLIEGMYDYDEKLDPSAIRHITSKARNGIWNFYRKEMDYFDEDRKVLSLENLSEKVYDDGSLYEFKRLAFSNALSKKFDEEAIIDKIIIEQELDSLTEHQKDILLMYYIDEMRQKDIAQELNINQANVSRAQKRGIKRLKDSLNP